MSLGIGPSYKKPGDNENGKVFYPITSLAEFYFSQIILMEINKIIVAK